MATAQNPAGGTQPDFKKIKEQADAEKAALDAQRALIEARAALATAGAKDQAAATELANRSAQAGAAKKVADAQAAAANARKAQAEAEAAAVKASLGEVPDSGITGNVTPGAKAGQTEAALLASRSVQAAAKRIVGEVLKKTTTSQSLLLYAIADLPDFSALISYRAQLQLVKRGFEEAQAKDNAVPMPIGVQPEVAPLTVAGAALQGVTRILGYFRSDYTVAGVDLTFADSMLVHAVAGAIASDTSQQLTVKLPHTYNPATFIDPATAIIAKLQELGILKAGAEAKKQQRQELSTKLTADAAKETDDPKKTEMLEQAAKHKEVADAWTAAVAAADQFFTQLAAADSEGKIPLADIIDQSVIATALGSGDDLLLVKIHHSGGSHYTKKNLWTFFGGMPFYNMGGVVASFALLDGNTGTVKAAGVVPVHGGFVKSKNVKKTVEKTP